MFFSEINPYVRYARYMKLTADTDQPPYIAYDARMFYTKSGSGIIIVGGKEYILEPGSALIVSPGVEYRYITVGKCVEYIILNFDYTKEFCRYDIPIPPSLPSEFKTSEIKAKHTFADAPFFDTVAYLPFVGDVESELTLIVNEYNHRLIHYHNVTDSLLLYCLTVCARRLSGNDVEYSEKSISKKIIEYIHNNYNTSLTNAQIGNQFGYHPNYISTLIKNHTGMPLHKYLIHIRLNKAVEMLEMGNKNISDIAVNCGFCDGAYFSGYFKKHFGVSPTKYKGV